MSLGLNKDITKGHKSLLQKGCMLIKINNDNNELSIEKKAPMNT